MENGKKYFYVDGSSGEVAGPNSLKELKLLQFENRISGDAQVTEEGTEDWMPFDEVLKVTAADRISVPVSQSVETPLTGAIPPPLPEISEQEWHYTARGKRLGPVTSSKLTDLAVQGVVDNDTLVWAEGFDDWIPFGKTQLKCVPSSPPPLTGAAVANGMVWVLAFVPIFGTYLIYCVAELMNINPYDFSLSLFIFLPLNIGLTLLDRGCLAKAGHDTKKFGGWFWLVPVYLYKRATALKQPLGYFLTWMFCFLISFVL
jgi:hypothetical protein